MKKFSTSRLSTHPPHPLKLLPLSLHLLLLPPIVLSPSVTFVITLGTLWTDAMPLPKHRNRLESMLSSQRTLLSWPSLRTRPCKLLSLQEMQVFALSLLLTPPYYHHPILTLIGMHVRNTVTSDSVN